jgi:hypothetical protein
MSSHRGFGKLKFSHMRKNSSYCYALLCHSNEEKDRGDTYGAISSGIGVPKELGDLRGGKDSPKREDVEQTLKQI